MRIEGIKIDSYVIQFNTEWDFKYTMPDGRIQNKKIIYNVEELNIQNKNSLITSTNDFYGSSVIKTRIDDKTYDLKFKIFNCDKEVFLQAYEKLKIEFKKLQIENEKGRYVNCWLIVNRNLNDIFGNSGEILQRVIIEEIVEPIYYPKERCYEFTMQLYAPINLFNDGYENFNLTSGSENFQGYKILTFNNDNEIMSKHDKFSASDDTRIYYNGVNEAFEDSENAIKFPNHKDINWSKSNKSVSCVLRDINGKFASVELDYQVLDLGVYISILTDNDRSMIIDNDIKHQFVAYTGFELFENKDFLIIKEKIPHIDNFTIHIYKYDFLTKTLTKVKKIEIDRDTGQDFVQINDIFPWNENGEIQYSKYIISNGILNHYVVIRQGDTEGKVVTERLYWYEDDDRRDFLLNKWYGSTQFDDMLPDVFLRPYKDGNRINYIMIKLQPDTDGITWFTSARQAGLGFSTVQDDTRAFEIPTPYETFNYINYRPKYFISNSNSVFFGVDKDNIGWLFMDTISGLISGFAPSTNMFKDENITISGFGAGSVTSGKVFYNKDFIFYNNAIYKITQKDPAAGRISVNKTTLFALSDDTSTDIIHGSFLSKSETKSPFILYINQVKSDDNLISFDGGNRIQRVKFIKHDEINQKIESNGFIIIEITYDGKFSCKFLSGHDASRYLNSGYENYIEILPNTEYSIYAKNVIFSGQYLKLIRP